MMVMVVMVMAISNLFMNCPTPIPLDAFLSLAVMVSRIALVSE